MWGFCGSVLSHCDERLGICTHVCVESLRMMVCVCVCVPGPWLPALLLFVFAFNL
jgi:hypothetical protein